ncbi:TPA: phage N-6-adenine-methyltransferase [Klebsiella pneumoniae subsp. pneumoniae]|nr:phage N-6-adenine-methyltransferase [Klebsiella pneumoniae]QDJ83921.1 phage N-6-adenine-methyltransferase [Klebsiella pneumoniae subsp. pneumoniae]MBC4026810.1 phage N-6-adenine-methyltransferase [Klebsiella pneumoniae]MBC4061800.1 phage N-6-adenine-methyltransferase [Klebsiella pneumoniae]MBK2619017.1 phage N-6-adenine-methyltransferase [Klebsiella pneumoniae]MBK3021336.1 phage N-6-adenine-methyltransferase [Klebsiella pneumoniae]
MIYGSICSGIEAATVAWEPLGWKAAWFSEIEAFPSAVLAERWPEVVNLGDMTKIAAAVRAGEVQAPDVMVGGTPCQAFSIAGLRNGLSDARGQLTLSYVELANAIDDKRIERGEEEAIFVWENVPGVLTSHDNAFGCFLAGLAGESCELEPSGGKWTHSGCVYGPQRTIAWIVKDAQYFGVAQRRKRVFVVASARKGFDPGQVLFESEGVRRDTPPSREPQTAVAALTARGVGTCGADDNQAQAGHIIAECANGDISHTLKAEGFDGSEDGTGRGIPVIAFGGGNTGGNIDVAACLTAKGQRIDFEVETFAVHGTQDPDTNLELAHTLGRNHGQENACIAFSYKDHGADASEDLSPTLRAGNSDNSNANGGQPPAIAYAFKPGQGAKARGIGFAEEQSPTLTSASSGTNLTPAVMHGVSVRRLMPVECERLQGFPDSHTLISWRGKEATECPDGPRYRAIGNSMAVPVMRWIGERIAAALPVKKSAGDYGGSNTPAEQRDLWRTPPALFACLNAEFCFQLDAAAAAHNALCRKFITAEQNTLETPWADYLSIQGYVWLNPPYSDITPFVKKAAAESANQIGTVMLVPADTSVGWFKEAIKTASEVRFITAGRLAFINPVTGKPVSGNNKGSMLIIWHPYPRTHCHFSTVERDALMNFGARLIAKREAA